MYEEFALTCTISPSRQGKHIKFISVVAHEDVKEKCMVWLKKRTLMERDVAELKKYIEDKAALSLFPDTSSNPIVSIVSITIIWAYLQDWGYKHRKNAKGTYFHGHERTDVAE